MNIQPDGALAHLFTAANRPDLLEGFDIDDDFLALHRADIELNHPDKTPYEMDVLSVYGAALHPNAPHNRKTIEPAAAKTDSAAWLMTAQNRDTAITREMIGKVTEGVRADLDRIIVNGRENEAAAAQRYFGALSKFDRVLTVQADSGKKLEESITAGFAKAAQEGTATRCALHEISLAEREAAAIQTGCVETALGNLQTAIVNSGRTQAELALLGNSFALKQLPAITEAISTASQDATFGVAQLMAAVNLAADKRDADAQALLGEARRAVWWSKLGHGLILLALSLLLALHCKADGKDSLIVGGKAAGSIVANSRRLAGIYYIDCGASTTFSAATSTLTCPGSSSGAAAKYADVFDGSTTALADGTTISWATCATYSKCATWTVPSGVTWVDVEVWGGGGPGLGTGSGNGGAGGAGGGFGRRRCTVTPGGTITVQVGLGGTSSSGYGAGITPGGDSLFSTCIGATGGTALTIYVNGNPPGAMVVNGVNAPLGPWVINGGFWSSFAVSGAAAGTPAQTNGYNAVREDQGGWPGSGYLTGNTGAGLTAGQAIGGGGGGGGGAAQSATPGAAGTSLFGGAGGTGGSSGAACTAGSVPGGGGGGAYNPAAGNTIGCAGARGEIRVSF